MQRILTITLAVVGCQSPPQKPADTAPLARPTTAPATPIEPTDPPIDQTEGVVYEPFVEQVELDAEPFKRANVRELTDQFVLVATLLGERKVSLMRRDTLELIELPPLLGDPAGRAHYAAVEEHGLLVARFVDEEARTVTFQVLRLEAKQWEQAGRFDLPKSRRIHPEQPRGSSAGFRVVDGRPLLTLTDEKDTVSVHELDPETLVWTKASSEPNNPGPCIMSSRLEGDADRVRWGFRKKDDGRDAVACIAVRDSVDDDWIFLDDPEEGTAFARSFLVIDDDRVLVTGGFAFRFPPLSTRNDIVDIARREVRPLRTQSLGYKMEVPTEPFLWIAPGAVTRFDPETEKFDIERGPDLGFRKHWAVRLDERTVLYGAVTGDEAHFARLGFRPTSEKTTGTP